MRLRIRSARTTALALVLVAAMVLVPAPALATEYSCDETGLNAALSAGGGPHTFDCATPTTLVIPVKTVQKDVILDFEGNLLLSGGGTNQIFRVNPGVSLEVHNTTITDGNGFDGGAIEVGASNEAPAFLTLVGVEMRNNRGNGGGAIYGHWDASITIIDSNLLNNTAAGTGGAVLLIYRGSLAMDGVTVSGNHGPSSAGGLFIGSKTTADIANSTFEANSSEAGGAIVANAAAVEIRDSSFTGNSASDSIHGGGAIFSGNSSFVVSRTRFAENSARVLGGAILLATADTLTVEQSAFTGNTAGHAGGAIAVRVAGSVELTESEFVANTAGNRGGAVYSAYSPVIATNTNFSGNSTTPGFGGGAIFIEDRTSLTVHGGQMVDNTSQLGPAIYAVNSVAVEVADSLIAANTSTGGEGAVTVLRGSVDITRSALLGNVGAGDRGSAVLSYHSTGSVTDSCIVGNEFPALWGFPGSQVATGNWWGDPTGPSGDGPGSGDGIEGAWDYTGFAAGPLPPCVYSEAPWAPGEPPSGVCEVLVWFDDVHVISDTDPDPDQWRITGAARFYDF
ncbi:MAG: hypothetical protein HKN01_08525, partial [Acidimicrobiia bacterium]|nr:hypothetical protein [Acidimicrobiia bacterium]